MERVMRRRSAREPLSRVKLFDHIGNLARDRRGSVLVLASMLLLVAGMSLSAVFDLSRLYFARNTAQIRADAAALAAVLPLDGTHEGLERAREAATQAARQAKPVPKAIPHRVCASNSLILPTVYTASILRRRRTCGLSAWCAPLMYPSLCFERSFHRTAHTPGQGRQPCKGGRCTLSPDCSRTPYSLMARRGPILD
jgi:hypothetical protein